MILTKDAYQEKEYKTFPFEMKDFKEDDLFFYFEGYLSTWKEDRGGDVVVKTAFDDFLREHKTLKLLWSHKSTDPPIGIMAELIPDDKGLYVKARMPREDAFVGGRIIPQMKIGSIDSMSMGFSIIGKNGAEFIDGKRFIKKAHLWEGSLVVIPMNAGAVVTKNFISFQDDLPIADRATIWNNVAALGRVMEWAGVGNDGIQDPDIQKKYQQAFLWFDEEDPDLVRSYKLMIADIIEGQLTVVPRAVFTAAAAIQGSRDWVWIWQKDVPGVVRTIERYYGKIGVESPFGDSFRVDDLSVLDEKTMEQLLRSGVCMSRKLSTTLVSFIKGALQSDSEEPAPQSDSAIDLSGLLKSLKSF